MEPADQEPPPETAATGEPEAPAAAGESGAEPSGEPDAGEQPDDTGQPKALPVDDEFGVNGYGRHTRADQGKLRENEFSRTGLDSSDWKTHTSIRSEGDGSLNSITSVTIQNGGPAR